MKASVRNMNNQSASSATTSSGVNPNATNGSTNSNQIDSAGYTNGQSSGEPELVRYKAAVSSNENY
jgi:hypothetical protein